MSICNLTRTVLAKYKYSLIRKKAIDVIELLLIGMQLFRYKLYFRGYLPPHGHTYRTYALHSDEIDCDLALEQAVINQAVPLSRDGQAVFLDHYWISAKQPQLLAGNVACLDYSVAKGGFLCAYRWQGEQTLRNENFVWVA